VLTRGGSYSVHKFETEGVCKLKRSDIKTDLRRTSPPIVAAEGQR
jgi:hypothetical protein